MARGGAPVDDRHESRSTPAACTKQGIHGSLVHYRIEALVLEGLQGVFLDDFFFAHFLGIWHNKNLGMCQRHLIYIYILYIYIYIYIKSCILNGM